MAEEKKADTSRIPVNIDFYDDRPPMKDSARRLLREYAKIPEDEIDAHVESIVSLANIL
jgi:hypothetical protein